MIMLLKNVACIYAKIQIIAHKENKTPFFRPFFINKGLLISFYVLLMSKLLRFFVCFCTKKFFGMAG